MPLIPAESVRQPHHDLPISMPPYRIEAFRRAMATRVRASGTDVAATIATLLREQQAIAVALADTTFAAAMSNDFVTELKLQEPNTTYEPDVKQAGMQMEAILGNRIRDAKGFAVLLGDSAFLDSVKTLAAQPAPAARPYDLPPEKKEEIVRRLVGAQDPDGPEPLVHVAAAALGHQIVHQALANIFRPKAGHLRAPLQEALARAWPEASPEQAEMLATNWLKARHDPAHSIADGLKPGGELYVAAMQRSEEAHAHLTAANAPKLTARELEKSKASLERAEDVAYTINHAISCLTTDVFIAPSFSALLSGGKLNWKCYLHEAGHYFKGEVAGDFLAVPLAIGVQRFFPGFMEGVNKFLDPLATPLFRHGSQRAAERWGKKHGLEADNQEVVDRAAAIFNHEKGKLKFVAMWNVFAFPIGVAVQAMLEDKHGHQGHSHGGSIGKIIAFKSLGALVSNGMLLAWRATMPDAAERFDKLDSKYIIRPTTRVFGKLFGINDDDVKRMEEKEKSLEAAPKWTARVVHDRAAVENQPSAAVS